MADIREGRKKQTRAHKKKARFARSGSSEAALDGRPVGSVPSLAPAIGAPAQSNGHPGGCLIKKARPEDPESLVREYEYLASLPEELKWAFPRAWGLETEGDHIQYRMDKVPLPSLAEAILGAPGKLLASKLDAQGALERLRHVLDFVVRCLHPLKVSPTTPDFLDRAVFQKYEMMRLKHYGFVQKRLGEMNGCSAKDYLDDLEQYRLLLEAPEVVVDGVDCASALEVLQGIKESPSLCRMLTPPRFHHIHGDLSFNNILVTTERKAGPDFILIDPRPWPGGGDMAKDFAQLLFSCQGCSVLFWRDYFDVEVAEEKGRLRIALRLWGDEPNVVLRKFAEGKGCAGIFEEVQILDGTELAVFQEVGRSLPGVIDGILAEGHEEKDDHWLMRAELHQAVSLCGIILPHLQESPKRALACHAMGVKLLNEWKKKYSS